MHTLPPDIAGDTPIEKLKNLGPKSARMLHAAKIHTLADLAACGAINAYIKVRESGQNASLNLLYALVGALENKHWQDVKRQQKHELILALDAYNDQQAG